MAARAAHGDAQALAGIDVDRGVAQPSTLEQCEPRQTFEHGGGKGGALAHRDDHVETLEACDQFIVVACRLREHHDRGAERQGAPVREVQGLTLIVVQDRDGGGSGCRSQGHAPLY